jgi:hypothetical protein
MRNRVKAIVTAMLVLLISPICAPQLLVFPYTATVGQHRIYSERPIDTGVTAVVSKADMIVGLSKLPTPTDQPIFLTQGGWRWRWLTQSGSDGPFGLSRAVVETIVINRSDPVRDKVYRKAAVGGERSLSGAIAHEMTHGAIRRHFGVLADVRYPQWLREGFCDYVAGGSTLSDAEAMTLSLTDPYHSALAYWRGLKRVEAQLRRNGGSVDRLFATATN